MRPTLSFVNGTTGRQPAENPERRWKIRQVVYGEALLGLDSVFSALGIEYMPMKGAHLICTNLSAKLPTREMHDIDLLVRPVDFEKTLAALEIHPQFTREPPDPWDFEQSFCYRHGRHLIHLEIHRALNRPERFSLDTDKLFDRATAQTAARWIMSPEDALIVLVCHTLVHLVDAIPDHAFREAAILSHIEGFSWERFEVLLRKTGVARFGRALLSEGRRRGLFLISPEMQAHRWALFLIRRKISFRRKGLATILFRMCVECAFVRHPVLLLLGHAARSVKWLCRSSYH